MTSPVCAQRSWCKICGGVATLLGVVDFNRNCLEREGVTLPVSGLPIYYRQCQSCRFIFTEMLDDWSSEQFANRIYNDEYIKVDPDYAEKRPEANANWIIRVFGAQKEKIACLDYGGGNGRFAALLQKAGFARAATYDEYTPEHRTMPAGTFNLVTCFEVFEHAKDPKGLVAALAYFIQDGGMIVFSTLLQPANIDKLGLSWWYIGPRNGHISIFSRQSLARLLNDAGLKLGSFSAGRHIAFRQVPDYALSAITLKSAPHPGVG